jgi:hypothetical protein
MGKSAGRPAGVQIRGTGAGGLKVKPRIIHTYSPKVYKIKPEEFLDLVQKLTGRRDRSQVDSDGATSASGFLSKSQDNVEISSSSHLLPEDHEADSGTPVSTHLLASLPSPRLVTLNFLPMLAASPSSFNQSRRVDVGFSFPSAAY